MLKKNYFKSMVLILAISVTAASGQTPDEAKYNTKKWYGSGDFEMIFSWADISAPTGAQVDQNMRWAPVFNPAFHANYDFSKNFGVHIGLAVRNVGFIAKFDQLEGDPEQIDRIKYRTYNLGLPVGIKLGNLHQDKPFFLFAGYELEMPVHYKEKRFSGDDKEKKISSWFTERTPVLMNALYAGIQLPTGTAVKFKYYLSEFFDSGYNPDPAEPSFNLANGGNANVFYVSLTFYPFRDVNAYW